MSRGSAILVVLVVGGACSVDSSGLLEPDAGTVPVADGCVPVTETCNDADDDCDGRVDEGFDKLTDPSNCGTCDNACPDPANASPVCAEGACGLSCNAGFADCNADRADGCESDLSQPANCGNCTTTCGGTTTLCQDAAGVYSCVDQCMPPQTRCGDSCVDTGTSSAHCGACDSPCSDPDRATAACQGGSCEIVACNMGFDDCNGTFADGCERNVTTVSNCGSCGTTCDYENAMAMCVMGTCAIGPCDAGFGNCNSDPNDGCETSTTTRTNCGGCGVPCNLANATESCSTGSCVLTACEGGFGDCDADASNGCETTLGTSANCLRCDDDCGDGVCGPSGCSLCPVTGCGCSSPAGVCQCTEDNCGPEPCNCATGCACMYGCGTNCQATCNQATCVIDATSQSTPTNISCDGNSKCTIEATSSSAPVTINCSGNGTECDIDCSSTSAACSVSCGGNARCVVECASTSGGCGIVSCSPGSKIVCGTREACGYATCGVLP